MHRAATGPGCLFAGVVDLVEHDDRRYAHEVVEQAWRGGDLLVGDNRAVHVGSQRARGIGKGVVELNAALC